MSDDRESSAIDRIAKLAGAVGFNETRVRWKLLRWRDRRREAVENAQVAAAHVSYEHAVCGHCGRILPRGTRDCPSCGSRLEPRWVQQLRRAGLHAPVPLSVSTLLGFLILVAFARQLAASPSGFMSFDVETLARLGAHAPFLETQGQWWRLGTAIFLHGGALHLLFNVIALSQVGPAIEDAFGAGRTLFFFVLMGTVANVPTLVMGRYMIGIGASGAIMGLAGMAAGWGQREGTSHGRALRNSMFMWLVYTTVFGLMLRVDHSAHVTGFATGFVLGFVFHGAPRRRGAAEAAFGLAGGLAAIALIGLVLLPPGLPDGMDPP